MDNEQIFFLQELISTGQYPQTKDTPDSIDNLIQILEGYNILKREKYVLKVKNRLAIRKLKELNSIADFEKWLSDDLNFKPVPESFNTQQLSIKKSVDYIDISNSVDFSQTSTNGDELKEVFVTYSWDNEMHINKVLSFTNNLRIDGFNAEVDQLVSQNETATDFYKMMHRAMTDYKNIIIVLSEGYKEKANSFKDGVGNEYSMIIKDIDSFPRKFILVSFEEISEKIVPLSFKGREIINLSKQENMNRLYSKLLDDNLIEFSAVGSTKPELKKKNIQDLDFKYNNIGVLKIFTKIKSSSRTLELLTRVEYELSIELKNERNEILDQYDIEVYYPKKSTEYYIDGRNEDKYKVMTYESNPKLFPNQSKKIKINNIIINNINAEEILDNTIKIKVYTKYGILEKELALSDILIFNEKKLSVDQFHNKNYY